jgi:AraC family transcriptional regulator
LNSAQLIELGPIGAALRLDVVRTPCNRNFLATSESMASQITPSISRQYLAPRQRPFLHTAHFCDTIDIVEVRRPAGLHGGPGVPRLSVAEMRSSAKLGRTDFGAGVTRDTGFRPGQFVIPAFNCARSVTVLEDHVFREFEPDPHLLRSVFEDAQPTAATFDLGVLHTGHAEDPTVSAILDHLWNEASTGNLGWRLATESAVVTLGVALLRARERLERAPPHAAVKRVCDWRVRRVIERMETEIGSDVGLRELAADVGLSPSHLSAVFVAAVGVPPHRWLLRRRVARARELLTRTRQSVTDIALSCGFSSSQHFATVFRKLEGCTPMESRRGRS